MSEVIEDKDCNTPNSTSQNLVKAYLKRCFTYKIVIKCLGVLCVLWLPCGTWHLRHGGQLFGHLPLHQIQNSEFNFGRGFFFYLLKFP